MTTTPWFLHTRLQRIDSPKDDQLSLTLRSPGQSHHLLIVLSQPQLLLLPQRPKGDPAHAWALKLRKELLGARCIDLRVQPQAGVILWLERKEGQRILCIDQRKPTINLALLHADAQKSLIFAYPSRKTWQQANFPHQDATQWSQPDLNALQTKGQGFQQRHAQSQQQEEQARWQQQCTRARKKLRRRLAAVQGDLERSAGATQLRHQASLIVAHTHAYDAEKHQVQVQDWAEDPPITRSITLDPRYSLQQQAERWFQQAKRRERGQRIASERYALTQTQIAKLDELQQQLRKTLSPDELTALIPALQAQGLRITTSSTAIRKRSAQTQAPRLPYRVFYDAQGRRILVGRSARDNDQLTFKVARSFDLWLHARGTVGSHVVVPLPKNSECPQELLLDAATLAVHFSDQRDEKLAEVQFTRRGHLRKPKKAPPGLVLVSREKTITLRMEPERLARLLATRDTSP